MPTLIDSLILKLRLDASGFKASKDKVDEQLNKTAEEAGKTQESIDNISETLTETGKKAKKTGETLEQAAKKQAAGFELSSRAVFRFFAAVGGGYGLKAFIGMTTESVAALERLAVNLNIPTQRLSAWGQAAEVAGGQAEAMISLLAALSRAQTELQLTGESPLIPFLSALKIDFDQPVEQLVLDIADALNQLPRTEAYSLGQLMGVTPDSLQLLLQGRSEIERLIAAQIHYGAVSKKQGVEAVRLQEIARRTRLGFKELGRTLLSEASPYLEAFVGWLEKSAKWLKDNKDFLKGFSLELLTLAATFGFFALAVSPLARVITLILALSAAMGLLYDDYKTWKENGKYLLPWQGWIEQIDRFERYVKKIEDYFSRIGSLFIFRAPRLFTEALEKTFFGEQKPSTEAAASLPSLSNKNLPRNIRNRNPVNLEFAGQRGAVREAGTGRFAAFETMQQGIEAGYRQLALHIKRKTDTIRKIVSIHAPKNENNTEQYIKYIAKASGIGENEKLSTANAQQMLSFMRYQINIEGGGKHVSDAEIKQAYKNVHIDEINIKTQATDAKSIAKDINYELTSQFTHGLF